MSGCSKRRVENARPIQQLPVTINYSNHESGDTSDVAQVNTYRTQTNLVSRSSRMDGKRRQSEDNRCATGERSERKNTRQTAITPQYYCTIENLDIVENKTIVEQNKGCKRRRGNREEVITETGISCSEREWTV